jgi:Uncharacterized protein conserved in bacteria (DUF2334)
LSDNAAPTDQRTIDTDTDTLRPRAADAGAMPATSAPAVIASRAEQARVDTQRNLRLHLGADESVWPAHVPAVLRSRPVPVLPVRVAERVAAKAGMLDWERSWLVPLMRARRHSLGAAAEGPPRFLVRIDEFPASAAYDDSDGRRLEAARGLHEALAGAGVPHVMAVLPEPAKDSLNPEQLGERPLSDGELALLAQMQREGVTIAQHGTTHRTRHADPRRHSELLGLDGAQTRELLDRGLHAMHAHGMQTNIFIPPFNRFAYAQWPSLAERYAIICGGPETIALVGFKGGPAWHGDSVYLPAYPPLYGHSSEALAAAEGIIDLAPGTWIPICLHTAWESGDDFTSLKRLAERIAPYSYSWDTFLDDVTASRGQVAAPTA